MRKCHSCCNDRLFRRKNVPAIDKKTIVFLLALLGVGYSQTKWVMTDSIRSSYPAGLQSLSYCQSAFFILGLGEIFRSNEGKYFSREPAGPQSDQVQFSSIAFGAGHWVALGDFSICMDPPRWPQVRSSHVENCSYSSIAFGNNLFVATRQCNQISGARIETSTNGENWVATDSNPRHAFSHIAFGNGRFIAVNDSIYSSLDGKTWAVKPTDAVYLMSRLTFCGGLFLIMCTAQKDTMPALLTSVDGETWTRNASGTYPKAAFESITYGLGQFMGLAGNREIFLSPDAVTWTKTAPVMKRPYSIEYLAFGNNKFLAFCPNGEILRSNDADTALWGPANIYRLNQLGFFNKASKCIVVKDTADSMFTITLAQGSDVRQSTGILQAPSRWPPSGETVRIADFSSTDRLITISDSCRFQVAGIHYSADFVITSFGTGPLHMLASTMLKSFYFQRASMGLTKAYADSAAWVRPAGHPDTSVTVHPSAGSGTISAPKGWYDGNDYGKYIVSSAITVYALLVLYEHFPSIGYYLDIPETGNPIPDILDETRWELEWMLAMQGADGGVYSKLTSLQPDGAIMPDKATATRYAFMKTTPASLDFAAVMAMSSRIYKPFDTAFAARCLVAAKKAYAWADSNPSIRYVQPTDCGTSQYGDSVFSDEFFWASIELALASGSKDYTYHTVHPLPPAEVPWWKSVGTLGLYTMLTNMQAFPTALVDSSKARVIAMADTLLARQQTGYRVSLTENDFVRQGSNGIAASQGNLLLYAYYLTGDSAYYVAAEQQMDYLLGRNPLNECYVTGLGSHAPQHPHHPVSQSDNASGPLRGFLVAGSYFGNEDSASCGRAYADKPATSWVDDFCASACNGVAIGWNAALAYCAGALDAMENLNKINGFKPGVSRAALPRSSLSVNGRITLAVRENRLVIRYPARTANASDATLRLYDAAGKQLIRLTMTANSTTMGSCYSAVIPLTEIANGFVIVRMERTGENPIVAHFVINR